MNRSEKQEEHEPYRKYVAEMEITVGWGDCDGAGIIYYPNYFRWFDDATWNYFESIGMPLEKITEQYQIVGFPLIDAQANFKRPLHFREKIVMRTEIVKIDGKILHIHHKAVKQEELLAAEGKEIRFWGKFCEVEKRLKAENIPVEFLIQHRNSILQKTS
ncbi:MAG: acyl-CoA thioesterase [SAR324 cluster bacterium]|nr:acyl-CoA thioesterase [SAR324 cluster bacterium]